MSYTSLNGSVAGLSNIKYQDSSSRSADQSVPSVDELKPIESNNWLVTKRYTRKEFEITKLMIQEDFNRPTGASEHEYYILGSILRQEGKVSESLKHFKKCVEMNPLNFDNHKEEGRTYYLLGQHYLAIEALSKAFDLCDGIDWSVNFYLGECFFKTGQYAKSRQHYFRSLECSKTEKCFLSLIELLIVENDLNGALDVYRDALHEFPTSSELVSSCGSLHLKVGNWEKAFNYYGDCLANDPKVVSSLIPLGAMIQRHGDYDSALAKYKIAGQSEPESIALWNNMGLCFFGKGKYVAAISCLKRANYLDPTDWTSLYNLGMVHLHTQQYCSSFHYLSACVQLKPNHLPSLLLLATVLDNLSDTENARKCFEKCRELDPDDVSTLVNYIIFLKNHNSMEEVTDQLDALQRTISAGAYADTQTLKVVKQLMTDANHNTDTTPSPSSQDIPLGSDEV